MWLFCLMNNFMFCSLAFKLLTPNYIVYTTLTHDHRYHHHHYHHHHHHHHHYHYDHHHHRHHQYHRQRIYHEQELGLSLSWDTFPFLPSSFKPSCECGCFVLFSTFLLHVSRDLSLSLVPRGGSTAEPVHGYSDSGSWGCTQSIFISEYQFP